jgi:hypothetical protein
MVLDGTRFRLTCCTETQAQILKPITQQSKYTKGGYKRYLQNPLSTKPSYLSLFSFALRPDKEYPTRRINQSPRTLFFNPHPLFFFFTLTSPTPDHDEIPLLDHPRNWRNGKSGESGEPCGYFYTPAGNPFPRQTAPVYEQQLKRELVFRPIDRGTEPSGGEDAQIAGVAPASH